jgi:integrase
MTNLHKSIYNYISQNNKDEKISQSSIKSYVSYIKKIYMEMVGDINFEAEFFLMNYKEIIKYIDDNIKNDNSKKSYIASILFVIKNFNDNNDNYIKKIYNEYMTKIAEKYNESKKDQTKNNKEINNWLTQEELKNKYEDYYKKYSSYLDNKYIKIKEYQDLQDLIIIALYYLNKPRRLKDYSEMKFDNYDILDDNYIDLKNKQFIFNIFKTSKFYENNKVDINNELYILLKKFIKLKNRNKNLNDTYLLENEKNDKLSNVSLNQRLNKIFDKKNISVNILRKSYISDIYKNIPSLNIINNISNDMANSFNEQIKSYIKK